MKLDAKHLAVNLLEEILTKNSPFAIALKSCNRANKLEKEDRVFISAIVGCELRHHLIFQNIVSKEFSNLEIKNLVPIYLALANNLFVKAKPNDEFLELIYEIFESNDVSYDKNEVADFFNRYSSASSLISEDISRGSLDFLSFRFNTPVWLIRMWQKHFGKGLTYKILKSNSKVPFNTCRVNTELTTSEKVLSNKELFKKTFVNDVVEYLGKAPIKKNPLYEGGRIFQEKMSLKVAFDKANIDTIQGLAIYQGSGSTGYLEAAAQCGSKMPMDLIFSSFQDYYEAKRNVQRFKLQNAKLYHCEISSIITCISKKVGTFVVMPKCSHLELLRTAPDYFLRFKQDMLDGLIAEQYRALDECSKFVELDGQILYIVPTLDVKEGHHLVYTFLIKHKNYEMVEERQFFPFDPYDSSLYFAILKKVGEDDD